MMTRLAALMIAGLMALPALAATTESKAPFAGMGKDRDKPINVSADTQQVDFEKETTTYSGNVRIQQGDMTLRADTVTATLPKGKLTRIEASGDVVITSADATARAPKGIYEVEKRTLQLTGGVVLTQGQNTVRGSELLVDMAANTAVLTGKGSPGGRVEGVLQPNSASTPKTN